MSATQVGIAQGVAALGFEVLDHREIAADGMSVAATVATKGDLMFYSAANTVSRASGDMAATAQYAGFIDNTVVSSMTGLRIDYHGEKILVSEDKATLWRVGRYRITNVSGTVGDNVKVYPADSGALSASQTGSAPAVGIARKGNGGVSGDPIEVEIDFIARLA